MEYIPRLIACLAICSLHFLIRSTISTDLHRNKEAAAIYPYTTYSKYKSIAEYGEERPFPTTPVDSVSQLSHFLYDKLIKDASELPYGYIKKEVGEDSVKLGHKIDQNDWSSLLTHYWGFLLCVVFLLLLIILMPFFAVCYCCFNWYKCPKGCPPCDRYKDSRERCCYGFILVWLLLGILWCVIIGFQHSMLLNHGLGESSAVIQLATENFCTFLRDVKQHMHHLLVNNCEELIAHLTYIIRNLNFLMYDATVRKVNVENTKNLTRIFDKMQEASILMNQVVIWQKDLIFYGGQFRDGLRAVKRDIIYACAVLCGNPDCIRFLETSDVKNLDSSECLHFDELPDPKVYASAMEDIYLNDYYAGKVLCDIWLALTRWEVGVKMVKAPLLKDIENGKFQFSAEAQILGEIIEDVVIELHSKTMNSTGTFDGIYYNYNNHRNIINATVGFSLLLIFLCFAIALLFGCCAKRRRSYQYVFCSKFSGARCMFLGILLIFCVFSFIILVGLFYLVLGFVTYLGACAPLKESRSSALPALNAVFDLAFKSDNHDDEVKMTQVITECGPNQTIVQLIKDLGLYNIDELKNHRVMGSHKEPTTPFFDYCIECYLCFNNVSYMEHFNKVFKTELNPYQGTDFTDNLCTDVTPVRLPQMIKELRDLRSSLWTQWGIYDWARIALYDEILILQKYQDEFYFKVIDLITNITNNILKIDSLILFERKPFGESLTELFEYTKVKEKEMRNIAKATNTDWRRKMPEHLEDQVKDYIRMVIRETNTNVGKCDPINYASSIGLENVCHHIVDPLNGLAFGILFGGLLLLPALYVAHRLRCLYSKIYPRPPIVEDGFKCEICTQSIFKPSMDDGHNARSQPTRSESSLSYCTCNVERQKSGAAMEEQESSEELSVDEEPTSSKNKRE